MMNSIFLPPGAMLVEVVPIDALDSRHMPVSGIFPRVAAVFGLHHFTFVYNISHLTFSEVLAAEVKLFVNEVQ